MVEYRIVIVAYFLLLQVVFEKKNVRNRDSYIRKQLFDIQIIKLI